MSGASIRPLSMIRTGQKARVAALAGGRHFQNRLVSMGLNVGCEIQVIRSSNGMGGPVLLALGQTRLAIGHGMAEKIMVSSGRGTQGPRA